MSLQDPIADMLTRIRNAVRNRESHVKILRSKVCIGIAEVLREEGFIRGFDLIEDDRQGVIRIELKYGPRGEQIIHAIDRVSKPSRRVYNKVDELPRVLDGLGIAIVSTSRGIFSDVKARKEKVGGEVLCTVQ